MVGLATSIAHGQFEELRRQLPETAFEDLAGAFNQIRGVRGPEELDWLRRGAELTDRACELLQERIRPGLTEHDLVAAVHQAFLPDGGQAGLEPWPFQENQVMVIQPNPVTLDQRAGLQLGAAVRVTAGAAEPLHDYPFKFTVCG